MTEGRPQSSDGSVVVVHPAGNANVRAVLRGLDGRGMLERFVTSVAFTSDRTVPQWWPPALKREAGRRRYDLGSDKIARHPWREAGRWVAMRMGWQSLVRHEKGVFSVDAVWRDMDAWAVGKLSSRTRAVYAYEDGAWAVFKEAKRRGILCCYDLPIGYHTELRRIFAEERERLPEFAATLEGLEDSPEKLQRKVEEAAMADVILAASPFVAETLVAGGVEMSKVRVMQFGAPSEAFEQVKAGREKGGALRVLFVGRIGQRKGIGDLLQAMRRLDRRDIELSLMGPMVGPRECYRPYEKCFKWLPPRGHEAVLEEMTRHDLLVLPTLFEGQALVVLEAMACGLPVLTTSASGAGHLVREGVEGWMVPTRAPEALAERLVWCAENREAVWGMGQEARCRAAEFTWEHYEREVVKIVEGQMGESSGVRR